MVVPAQVIAQIRQTVLEKRERLAEWLGAAPPEEQEIRLGMATSEAVRAHLRVLEETLHKVEAGNLGDCEVCHTPVESELLQMDYTSAVCLTHFSEQELRRLEFELELAGSVQRSLLPAKPPKLPALEIAGFSRPAQLVGGDYFDFFQFTDGAHGLAIADVSGHGISAGLHMAGMQALLRTLIPTNRSPAEVLAQLDRLIIHNLRFSAFVSLFLAAFDAETRMLRYASAGHNPPLLLRPGEAPRWLAPTGPALGLIEDSAFTEETLPLAPGDRLLLYTDGVTEAMNAGRQQFGSRRLAAALENGGEASAKEMLQLVREALATFTTEEALADDVTMVALRVRET
jgi:sigma-B regulation protein RsbU (phosphoserine phosphatase)